MSPPVLNHISRSMVHGPRCPHSCVSPAALNTCRTALLASVLGMGEDRNRQASLSSLSLTFQHHLAGRPLFLPHGFSSRQPLSLLTFLLLLIACCSDPSGVGALGSASGPHTPSTPIMLAALPPWNPPTKAFHEPQLCRDNSGICTFSTHFSL